MTIFKKYSTTLRLFVVFLTMAGLSGCASGGYRNTRVEAHKTTITGTMPESQAVERFIAPYRDRINRDLDSVLAYAPITYDKSQGKWQSPMGNMLAEATLRKAGKLLYSKEKQHVDACLLNYGGIRSIIAQGPVTTRTAFEVMPFENSLVVVKMKGAAIRKMADYIIAEKKAHPMAGITIKHVTNRLHNEIYIKGEPIQDEKTYNIATIDYLLNGGDNMVFFAENEGVVDLNYKLRDLYIDYFKEVDTLPITNTEHVIIE